MSADKTHVQYAVIDEEHTHTDAELIELWVTSVLGFRLEPFQRAWLNAWAVAQ